MDSPYRNIGPKTDNYDPEKDIEVVAEEMTTRVVRLTCEKPTSAVQTATVQTRDVRHEPP